MEEHELGYVLFSFIQSCIINLKNLFTFIMKSLKLNHLPNPRLVLITRKCFGFVMVEPPKLFFFQVLEGERLTLTVWFTRNSAHDEDVKLISLLSQRFSDHEKGKSYSFSPLPASDNMYWFSNGISGFDIRCARIQNLGFRICSSKHQEFSTSDMEADPLELLNMPIRLARGDEIFDMEFLNSLHGLQVISANPLFLLLELKRILMVI